jgi:hypothetical protein
MTGGEKFAERRILFVRNVKLADMGLSICSRNANVVGISCSGILSEILQISVLR